MRGNKTFCPELPISKRVMLFLKASRLSCLFLPVPTVLKLK